MKKLFLTILFTIALSGGAFAEKLNEYLNNKQIQSELIYVDYRDGKFFKPKKPRLGNWNFYGDGTGDVKFPKVQKINFEWNILSNNLVKVEETPRTKKSLKHNIEFNFSEGTITYYDERFKKEKNRIMFKEKFNRTGNSQIVRNNNNSNSTQNTKKITFNIKEKKEQCTAIGFKPETEKFADCVLRLVELDVKQQTQNQITVAQNNGNDALVKQLQRQNNLQSSQALIDLGQQLMNPKRYNSNIYLPQTQRCFMQGFGTFATMRCR